jgi:cell division protein FtsL
MTPMFLRIFICITAAFFTLYTIVFQQNQLTELRLKIPALNKQLKSITEENNRLQYEIDRFESPIHLMELARKPEFGYLKHPNLNEITILQKEKKDDR